MGAVPPFVAAPTPSHRSDNGPGGGLMAPPPSNPRNVPTGGNATYMALERITPKQLGLIRKLKRAAGDPPTWDNTCTLILGDDWDGVYETLSSAAASWLIFGLQRGLAAVREDDYVEGSPV